MPSTSSNAIVIGTTLREGGDPKPAGDQDAEDLLRRVGGRRQVVAGEDGEGGRLPEPLVDQSLGRERRSDDLALEAGGTVGHGRDERGGWSSCPLVGACRPLRLLHALQCRTPRISVRSRCGPSVSRSPQDARRRRRALSKGVCETREDEEGPRVSARLAGLALVVGTAGPGGGRGDRAGPRLAEPRRGDVARSARGGRRRRGRRPRERDHRLLPLVPRPQLLLHGAASHARRAASIRRRRA